MKNFVKHIERILPNEIKKLNSYSYVVMLDNKLYPVQDHLDLALMIRHWTKLFKYSNKYRVSLEYTEGLKWFILIKN